MEAIQVVMLALTALAVGVMCTVMVQLYVAVRQMRAEVVAVRGRIEPMLDRINASSQVAAALGVALAAAAKAFGESRRANGVHRTPEEMQ
jgi:hypothetical protein